MSKGGKGVLMADPKEPTIITGYLIIGDEHYEIKAHRISAIRTHLDVRRIKETEQQEDLFDEVQPD